MTYMEEAYKNVVKNNPGEPEYHQAVLEVLSSARLVIDANEKRFREAAVLERLAEPERSISGWMTGGSYRLIKAGESSFPAPLAPTREVCGSGIR